MIIQSSSSYSSVNINGKKQSKSVGTYIKDNKGVLVIGKSDDNDMMKYGVRKLNDTEIKNIKEGKFVRNLCNGECQNINDIETYDFDTLLRRFHDGNADDNQNQNRSIKSGKTRKRKQKRRRTKSQKTNRSKTSKRKN
jgi:hypothetical protein